MRKKVAVVAAALAVAIAAGTGYSVAQTGTAAVTPVAGAAHARPMQTIATPTVDPETYFVGVPTCRIVNTAVHGGAFAPGQTRDYVVAGTQNFPSQGGTSGGCGIPTDATAFAARLITVTPTGTGAFTAYPFGGTPSSSGVAYYTKAISSSTSAQLSITPNSAKNVTIRNYSGHSNLIIDVTGYYVAQMEAEINGDGSIQTGSSRILDVVKGGTGLYYVDLDRDVRDCSVQATAYNIYRYASAGYSSATTPNRVSIYLWYLNGTTPTTVDYPFHLLVSC